MTALQFKKDWLLEKLKILSSFTISSIILINCYGYLLNNTIKTSKNNKIFHNPQPVKQEYIKETEEKDDDFIDLQSLDIPNEEVIIESFSKSLENNIDLKISADLAVYDEMVKLGVILPELTTEEKINWILENYHLTMDQYKTIVGVVLAEGGDYNYEECYAVINTIFNRSICSRWVDSVNRGQGEGLGRSLYNQVIQKRTIYCLFL